MFNIFYVFMKLKKFSGLFIPQIFCTIICIYSHRVHSLYLVHAGYMGGRGIYTGYMGGGRGTSRVHEGTEPVHSWYMGGEGSGTFMVYWGEVGVHL